MTKILSVLLLAILAIGVLGAAQTAVTPRTAEGVLLYDNQTGLTVAGINVLFEQDIEVALGNVVVVGGGNVTNLDVEGRSVWIDVEVEPNGTLSLGLGVDYVGAAIKTAHWFASIEEKNKIITLRLLQDLWNQGDLKTADELVAPDFILHDMSLVGDVVGIEGYKGFLGVWTSAFPDFQLGFEDMAAEGELVGIRLTATGTHQDTLMGIPATGLPMQGKCLSVWRFADNRAKEQWLQADIAGMLTQLGILPPMGPPNYAWGTPTEAVGSPGTSFSNRAIASRDPLEIFNEGNVSLIDVIISESFVGHYDGGREVAGIEGYKEYVQGSFLAFPDFQITVDEIFGEGNLVFFISTASATHTGPLGAIPATGMPWKVNAIVVRRVVDGKIVETWQLNDMLSLLMQIGLVPPLQ